MNKTVIKGVSLAVLAGLCWGSMAVVAQHLMMNREVNGEQLAVLRILGPGFSLYCLTGSVHAGKASRTSLEKKISKTC